MFKIEDVGKGEIEICDGIVQVATVRRMHNGWFEVRVPGVGWSEDGFPMKGGGLAYLAVKRRDEAIVIATQTAERYKEAGVA